MCDRQANCRSGENLILPVIFFGAVALIVKCAERALPLLRTIPRTDQLLSGLDLLRRLHLQGKAPAVGGASPTWPILDPDRIAGRASLVMSRENR